MSAMRDDISYETTFQLKKRIKIDIEFFEFIE